MLGRGSGRSEESPHESENRLPTHRQGSSTSDEVGHVQPEGESGRRGFHPWHFLRVLWKSSCEASKWVNLLWPVVPVAIALHCLNGMHLAKFATAYVAVIPAANLLGFAGQEFARKMPKVAGILIETTFGSVVEIILFVLLIVKHQVPAAEAGSGEGHEGNLIPVIQAAILGSILTNLLLCLGLCFYFGGLRQATQKFHAIVSEVGTGLLLVAAFGLLIPSAFYSALKSEAVSGGSFSADLLKEDVVRISRATSIALMVAFVFYLWFQARSQHGLFDEIIEMDEHRDADRHEDLSKTKFTMTEALVALVVALAFVTIFLIFLVEQIEHVVASGVPDQFLGLILLPLVEKAAEHLTAVDEAWGKLAFLVPIVHLLTTVILNRWSHQRRAIPLPRPFDTNSSFQRPVGRHGWLGTWKAHGSQL